MQLLSGKRESAHKERVKVRTGFRRRGLWVGGALLTAVLLSSGCTRTKVNQAGSQPSPLGYGMQQGQRIEPVQTSEADWKSVADTLGRPGRLFGRTVYRGGFARSDLKVTSQGVQIRAELSLNSVGRFTRYGDGQVLMGDLVVTEDELQRVTDALHANGIAQTAIHKHMLGQQPQVWWTHIHALGADPVALARGVRAALDVTGTPPAATALAAAHEPALDTAALDQAMGTKGMGQGGLYMFSFVRKETVTEHERVVPAGLGLNTAIGFQPTGDGKAVITGDFCMTAEEVQTVIEALRTGGIQIAALHNHMLDESPRLFFLHFWANDDAVKLAKALRKAVDAQNVTPMS